MFGSMVAYSVAVPTWRSPAGDMWQPNTIVNLRAEDAMIYNSYDFIIRGVEFQRERDMEKAVLDLVIPGSFSGKVPEALPWDE